MATRDPRMSGPSDVVWTEPAGGPFHAVAPRLSLSRLDGSRKAFFLIGLVGLLYQATQAGKDWPWYAGAALLLLGGVLSMPFALHKWGVPQVAVRPFGIACWVKMGVIFDSHVVTWGHLGGVVEDVWKEQPAIKVLDSEGDVWAIFLVGPEVSVDQIREAVQAYSSLWGTEPVASPA